MKICAFLGQSIEGNQDKYIAEILRILETEIGDENTANKDFGILVADLGF